MRINDLENTVEKLKDLQRVEDALEEPEDIIIVNKEGRNLNLSELLGDLVTKLTPFIQSGVALVRSDYIKEIGGVINE